MILFNTGEKAGATRQGMDSVEKTHDQQHPQYKRERASVDTLLAEETTDYNLSELARLIIRYRGFPGARNIQLDLKKS